MIIKFQLNVPMWQRLKILYYGRVFVMANYKGAGKPLHVEMGAVNPRKQIQGNQEKVQR